jgi:hypothetical protein
MLKFRWSAILAALAGLAAICTILLYFGQTPEKVGAHLHDLGVLLKAQNWWVASALMLATAAVVLLVVDLVNKRAPIIAVASSSLTENMPSPAVVLINRGQVTHVVRILSPVNGTFVGFKAVVTGTVDPPNSPVQVLVKANDDRWYPQGKNRQAEVNGSTWTVNCQFGNNNAASQHAYHIVAITGTSVKDPIIPFLPEDVAKSEIISVKRTFD